jgi:hypothetical protein
MNSNVRLRRQRQANVEHNVRVHAKSLGLKLVQCGDRNGEEPTYNLLKDKKRVGVALTIEEARAQVFGSVTDTPQSEQPDQSDSPALQDIAAAINSTVDSLIKGEPDIPEQPEPDGQRGVVATIDKLEEIEGEIVDGEIVDDHMDVKAARELTDDIKRDLDAVWGKVVRAYHGRADIALGYESWDEYCVKEFGTARLRIPSEERAELVTSLRAAGLSYRALESHRDLQEHRLTYRQGIYCPRRDSRFQGHWAGPETTRRPAQGSRPGLTA